MGRTQGAAHRQRPGDGFSSAAAALREQDRDDLHPAAGLPVGQRLHRVISTTCRSGTLRYNLVHPSAAGQLLVGTKFGAVYAASLWRDSHITVARKGDC